MFRLLAQPSRAGALCLFVALGGCATVGPDYKAPKLAESEVPRQWASPAETAARARPATQWWKDLDDQVLDQLVADAFRNSPTLEAAMARLRQSRLAHDQADAAALPTVDGSASAERSKSGSTSTIDKDRSLSLSSSWELDLFGAVTRGKEGEAAREEAQRATLADARVSLSGDVTEAYLALLACRSNLELNEQDMASRITTEKLTADSVESGFTAPFEAVRSRASVASARTRVADTQAQCRQIENQLTQLTGIPRAELATRLAAVPSGLARLAVPEHFDIASPGEALMQRPDIRAAERRLAAASADIGLAEADRYPRLAFNGSLGYSASGTSGGGMLSFGTWSFGPSLSLPIFDGGRRKAAVEIAKSRYEESLANYKAKARRAIQEVEDGLTRYAAACERTDNARTAASEYQRFFTTVEARYREGASNLLELEDARRAMLDAQQTLLGVQKERLQAWIALNRATGGAAQYVPAPASARQ